LTRINPVLSQDWTALATILPISEICDGQTFAQGEKAAVATRKLTNTIPTVCPLLADPVRFGLISSESRPTGNVTGLLFRIEGLVGKQIELALDWMSRPACADLSGAAADATAAISHIGSPSDSL